MTFVGCWARKGLEGCRGRHRRSSPSIPERCPDRRRAPPPRASEGEPSREAPALAAQLAVDGQALWDNRFWTPRSARPARGLRHLRDALFQPPTIDLGHAQLRRRARQGGCRDPLSAREGAARGRCRAADRARQRRGDRRGGDRAARRPRRTARAAAPRLRQGRNDLATSPTALRA